MILYNITALVEKDIEIEFREWVHRVFLSELAKSERFKTQSLLKVLDSPNEGETYCIQLIVASEEEVSLLKSEYIPRLNNKIQELWSNQVYIFESKMAYIAMF